MEERLKKIEDLLTEHDKRIAILEGSQNTISKQITKSWYKSGSTIEKVICLTASGFFSSPRTISDIITELKANDFHFKASDLTLPLRKIVRKGLLSKTKKKADGTTSGKWMYLKG